MQSMLLFTRKVNKSVMNIRTNHACMHCNHAKETCPFFPGEKIFHKGFGDPSDFTGTKDEILKEDRRVRDEIKDWLVITFGREGSKSR